MEKNVSLHELELAATQFMKRLNIGDVIYMEGDLGAGKTTFVRAAIQSVAGIGEVVPSPTFTLVQTYDTHPPIWHYDLYRLTDPQEILELGIEEAFSQGVTFIEWPQRMGDLYKGRHYSIILNSSNQADHRLLTIVSP